MNMLQTYLVLILCFFSTSLQSMDHRITFGIYNQNSHVETTNKASGLLEELGADFNQRQAHAFFSKNNYDQATKYAKKAINQTASRHAQIEGYVIMGASRSREKKYEAGLWYLKKAMQLIHNDQNPSMIQKSGALIYSGKCHYELGVQYSQQNNFYEYLDHLFTALSCYKQVTSLSIENNEVDKQKHTTACKSYPAIHDRGIPQAIQRWALYLQNSVLSHEIIQPSFKDMNFLNTATNYTDITTLGMDAYKQFFEYVKRAQNAAEKKDIALCIQHLKLALDAYEFSYQCFAAVLVLDATPDDCKSGIRFSKDILTSLVKGPIFDYLESLEKKVSENVVTMQKEYKALRDRLIHLIGDMQRTVTAS